MRLQFRSARPEDVPRIMELIGHAQRQLAATGSDQWQNGYPAVADIAADLAAGVGRVLEAEAGVMAYGAVVYDGEPAYGAIEEGAWLSEGGATGAYVVLHRLAVAPEAQRQGTAVRMLEETAREARERGCRSFRVDTHALNGTMQRLLHRTGFVLCGRVHYPSGERLAYERWIDRA